MTTRTILAIGMLALATSAGACTFTASTSKPTEVAKSDAKPADPPKGAPAAKGTVPDAPKTPAPKVTAKPAKYEIPSGERSAPAAPDSWDVVQDEDFGLQFRVPSHWNSDASSDDNSTTFVASAPDDSMLLAVTNFGGDGIGDEEILKTYLDNLGFQSEGQYRRVADGLVVADGIGNVEGQKMYFVAMVYAVDDVNYVAYIITPNDQAAKNKETMRQILESFELI